MKAIGNTADDIRAHCTPVPDRNAIVAALLARLVPALEGFPRHGLTPHLDNWHACDALRDHEVRVENAGEITRGVARGIDAHGALLVETPAGVRRFISGEVTVRIEHDSDEHLVSRHRQYARQVGHAARRAAGPHAGGRA